MVPSWNEDPHPFGGGGAEPQGFREQAEQVLDLVRRRKWLILATCLAVVAGAALYTYTQVPVYRTSSLVLVEKEEQSTSATETGGMSRGSGLLPSSNSIRNELIFLRNSQALRRQVAKRLVEQGEASRLLSSKGSSAVGTLLDRAWTEVTHLVGGTQGASGEGSGASGPDSTQVSAAALAPRLGGRVQFRRAGSETNVIQIVAQDEDPVLAQRLADLYTQEYIALTQESSRARVTASRKFLQERSEELEAELEAAERKIQRYQQTRDAISLDQRESSMTSRIADIESDLEQARIELEMERASLSSLQDELEAVRPEELSDRVGSTVDEEIGALRSKIAELELSKQELQLQSGPLSPTDSAQVAQIERRIGDLRDRISELSDRYVNELMAGGMSAEEGTQRLSDLRRQIAEKRIRISGLESRIEVLSNRLEEYERELESIPQKSMELAQLMRDRKYAERMYGFVTEQLQQTRVREKSELGYATQIAEAGMPGAPVRPRPQRNLMLGLVLGLLSGLGLALLRDQLDNRLYKPDQLQDRGYREIGLVPNLEPLIKDQLEGASTVEVDGHQLDSSLVAAVKPQSAAAESYRKLRTNIQLGRPDHPCNTVLVTSPGSGDGKSLTTANLAIVMAQSGRSTLLIDADLRRPRLHKLFGVSRTPGVTEALQNDLRDHTMKNPSIENLCVLPAGTAVDNPSEVLASDRFREFLHRAQQYFDQVIVDSSPVLATTDGPLLSDTCDTTLCVVRGGVTTEAELDRAMEVLEGVGADVAGVVFNGFDVSMAYGYKYRYRHYGQYGPYDQYRSLPESTA